MRDDKLRASVCKTAQHYLVSDRRDYLSRAQVVEGIAVLINRIVADVDILKRACYSLLVSSVQGNHCPVRIYVDILYNRDYTAQNIKRIRRIRMSDS